MLKPVDLEAVRIRAAVAGGQHARDVACLLRELLVMREENAQLRAIIRDCGVILVESVQP